MRGLVHPDNVSNIARARSASPRPREWANVSSALRCWSPAVTRDLPATPRLRESTRRSESHLRFVGQAEGVCLAGTSHPEAYDPDSWTDEFAHLSQPGQREIQAALLYDYRTNVASYPAWQAWLREHKPPTLVAWGANDPSFIAAGATAFRADLPDAEIHLLDAGHFALEEKNDEIARLILHFMARHPG